MSNVIQIKHGANKPADGKLAPYELGYSTSEEVLYIGDDQGKAKPVVSSTTPIARGGTGATTAAGARTNLEVNTKLEVLQSVYPVGAIYISTVETNPATLFGFGTWEQIKASFLVGEGTSENGTFIAGSSGGNAYHSHGLNNHTHTVKSHTHGLNSHTHTVVSHSHGLNSHTHSISLSGTIGGTAITEAQMPKHQHVQQLEYTLTGTATSGRKAMISSQGEGDQEYGYYFPGTKGYMALSTDHVMLTRSAGSGNTHTHTFSGSGLAGQASGNTANSAPATGGPSTSVTTSSAPDTGGPNTTDTTSVAALPPYLVVYMWKRTA